MTAFQLFSKRLPPVPKSGVARSLNLLAWSDGRIWIEWIDNRGHWQMRHITLDYADRLIHNARLEQIIEGGVDVSAL